MSQETLNALAKQREEIAMMLDERGDAIEHVAADMDESCRETASKMAGMFHVAADDIRIGKNTFAGAK